MDTKAVDDEDFYICLFCGVDLCPGPDHVDPRPVLIETSDGIRGMCGACQAGDDL